MRLLPDECLPRRLKPLLAAGGHESQTAGDAGLSGKENGEFLDLAEEFFDVLVTIDKSIPYQQNLAGPKIAVLVIRSASNDLGDIEPHVAEALAAL